MTNSLVNNIMGNAKNPAPAIGMGATILGYTDRYPVTVIAVAGKRITVQRDACKRTDSNGMSDAQSYEFAPDPSGVTEDFSLRRNGAWVSVGDSIHGGTRILLGHRSAYYDYSF